jgi:hypothetical protein
MFDVVQVAAVGLGRDAYKAYRPDQHDTYHTDISAVGNSASAPNMVRVSNEVALFGRG